MIAMGFNGLCTIRKTNKRTVSRLLCLKRNETVVILFNVLYNTGIENVLPRDKQLENAKCP